MAENPYQTLGIAKSATAAEIRAAYRKLAKKHHPDLNPGNKTAEEKFKTISTAHELLSDPARRARFDAGEIDETGAEKAPPRSWRPYGQHPSGQPYGNGGQPGGQPGAENFEDIFSNIFGNRANPSAPARGTDARYTLKTRFLDAVNGATNRLTLPDGQTLDVKIPHGTENGHSLRLRQRGLPGRNGGPAGDALIEIEVEPHPFFTRDGQNIHLEVPLTLAEAVLGGKITIPTPAGPVAMNIRPHTESGTEMRLRERGVPAHGHHKAGDLYIKLRILTGPPDAALEQFLKNWAPSQSFNPRAALEAAMQAATEPET